MEAELAALASSGATALVSAMVSDAWGQVRDRVARFLGRGGDPAGAAEELSAAHTELVTARDEGDGDAAQDIEAEWRARLRRVLRADPAAAAELRALLAELESADGPRGGTWSSHQTMNVFGNQYGPVVQAGNVSGGTHTHFHGNPYPAQEPQPSHDRPDGA